MLTEQEVEQAWCFDEGRFGLKVWFRRRWCPYGDRPPWVYDEQYEWWWLYAAVRPTTGDSFFLLLPGVDTACLQVFLDAFRAHVDGSRLGVVLDGSGAHRAGQLRWPDRVVPLSLPPYSPELNPVERLFAHLRQRLANRLFADLEELAAAITAELGPLWAEPKLVQSLTGYPWWLEPTPQTMPSPS